MPVRSHRSLEGWQPVPRCTRLHKTHLQSYNVGANRFRLHQRSHAEMRRHASPVEKLCLLGIVFILLALAQIAS